MMSRVFSRSSASRGCLRFERIAKGAGGKSHTFTDSWNESAPRSSRFNLPQRCLVCPRRTAKMARGMDLPVQEQESGDEQHGPEDESVRRQAEENRKENGPA